MKNKILRLSTALALLVTGCQAHAFPPVLFNSTNGNVVLPTNFWAANSNALNQVISQLASSVAPTIDLDAFRPDRTYTGSHLAPSRRG